MSLFPTMTMQCSALKLSQAYQRPKQEQRLLTCKAFPPQSPIQKKRQSAQKIFVCTYIFARYRTAFFSKRDNKTSNLWFSVDVQCKKPELLAYRGLIWTFNLLGNINELHWNLFIRFRFFSKVDFGPICVDSGEARGSTQ